jgi:hypothetical protein
MIEFSIENNSLKKALTLANTATGDTKNSIESHCLFDLKEDKLTILSSNKSTCFSRAVITTGGTGTCKFTVEPSKVLNLISMSGSNTMKFIYHPETTTLEIHASEEDDSFVSLTSLDPAMFPDIEDNFTKAYEIKTLDAGVFLKALQFTKGFMATGQNAGKFGNVYCTDSVFYGTNGNDIAGVYTSSEFTGLTELIFPGTIISQLTNIINKLNFLDVSIRTTSNAIIIFSTDFAFGFTKVQVPMPRAIISVQEPTTPGWEVEKALFLKKIGRLQVSGESGMGIDLCFNSFRLDIATKAERPSRESMACKGTEDAVFTADCWLVERILSLFEGTTLKIHSGKRRINLYSTGSINIQEKDDKERVVPFTAASLIALAAV